VPKLLRQIEQDGPGLEHADRLGSAAILKCGNLGVRIDGYETAAELLALPDVDEPGVVLGPRMPQCEQLLEHDGDFLAVGGAQRIEL
jgi:hypothetical protein